MRKPNDKQVALIEGYLATGNAYGSAKKAGYSESWARIQAKHWLEKGKGAEYIAEILNDSKTASSITVEKIVSKLHYIAFRDPDAHNSERIRALELLGKWKKMFTDRTEHIIPQLEPVSTEEQIKRLEAKLRFLKESQTVQPAFAE